MRNFIEDIVSSQINNPQFVHAQIDNYYEIEKEVFGEIRELKLILQIV